MSSSEPRGAPAGAASDSALEELPFPRYSLALVQDESEMLLQPAYDLFAFLDDESDQRWDVELYTQRTIEALVHSDRQFDAIVIGLNAASKGESIRRALSTRGRHTGLCVLHQHREGSLGFLDGAVGADIVEFGRSIDRVATAEKLDPDSEILLNWPDSIPRRSDPAEGHDAELGPAPMVVEGTEAYVGLARGAMSSWRTVLEVEHGGARVPVLLRTRAGADPPVVLCTVLLEPRDPTHAALLGNILLWCVSGRPEAVVVGTPESHEEAQLVHRKLRMQGRKAIAARLEADAELDFAKWPYRGIDDVVLPSGIDPTLADGWPHEDPSHARDWLRGGGRLIRLGPGERLAFTHGESDAHWVTKRWAAWLASTAPESWQGSVIATRAVLRFLGAVFGDPHSGRAQSGSIAVKHVLESLEDVGAGIDPTTFALSPPSHFTEPVSPMLEQRLGRSRPSRFAPVACVEESVSTTAAVLDINALLGGDVLDAADVESMTRWLAEGEFPGATVDNQLEIARCLAEPELLERALAGLAESSTTPMTAARETKIREAVVACDVQPGGVDAAVVEGPSTVERGLRMSPLLCAHYLIALGDLRAHWRGTDVARENRLLEPEPRVVDRAVIAMGRHGPLLREPEKGDRPPPELFSATALALFAYFGRHAVPTHVIRGGESVPTQVITAVLNESEQLRAENAKVVGQTATIRRASNILGAIGMIVAVLLTAAFVYFLIQKSVPWLVQIPLAAGWFALFTLAALAALKWLGLLPPWGTRVGLLFEEGKPGLRKRLGAFIRGAPASDESS